MMCQCKCGRDHSRSLQIKLVNCVNNKSRTTNSEKLSVSLNKNRDYELRFYKSVFTESLILAQNERWRRGLGMQVKRDFTL